MIKIDLERAIVSIDTPDGEIEYSLGSAEGFAAVSKAWLRAGWDAKHVYSFTWMGRPMIQLPEDMIRLQEVIYKVRPTLIIETGVAHGGSLVFYASLFHGMGDGRVIGVDIEIRPHNRSAIESHPLSTRITLIEGSSTDPATIDRVMALIRPDDRIMILLDSNHTCNHVLAELNAYAALVSEGSYIVAMDGIMGEVAGAPRTCADWSTNNPSTAAKLFAADHPEFVIEEPEFLFNEGHVRGWVTYWPGAFLKRMPRSRS